MIREPDNSFGVHVGKDGRLYILFAAILFSVIMLGVVMEGPAEAAAGFARIQALPARLLQDFSEAESDGAALVNAALVAFIGLGIVAVTKVRFSGPTIAAVLTMFGFGLFGKTPLNITPVILGVLIAAHIAGKKFNEYILMALFGTALGPLASAVAVEAGLPIYLALPAGVLSGLIAGMLLPALAIVMLRLHQGFSLYNIGLTCGFIGVVAAAFLVAAGRAPGAVLVWNTNPSPALVFLAPAVSVVFVVAGILWDPKGVWRRFVAIQKLSGRLPSDFLSLTSTAAGLLNMGAIGLLTWGYVMVVGGDVNGPVLGGIFTAIGFAAFGKHPRNSWSIMVGVVIATLVYGKSLTAPGPILAALFSLTLAPLAGEFGPVVGFVAGFVHLTMVERTGAWHLGINLYNNGFAGGITAAVLVAVIEWFRSTRNMYGAKSKSEGSQKGTHI